MLAPALSCSVHRVSATFETGYHNLRDTIKEQIPLDVEISRVRDLIVTLKPEIAGNLKVIAREEVEVATVATRSASKKRHRSSKSKQAILKLKDDVQSGSKFVSLWRKGLGHGSSQEGLVRSIQELSNSRSDR